MKKAEWISENTEFNFVVNEGEDEKLGIITAGVSHAYCIDILKRRVYSQIPAT